MVEKSPKVQPTRQRNVFTLAHFHTSRELQKPGENRGRTGAESFSASESDSICAGGSERRFRHVLSVPRCRCCRKVDEAERVICAPLG
jgi:hypothetical protein